MFSGPELDAPCPDSLIKIEAEDDGSLIKIEGEESSLKMMILMILVFGGSEE